MDDFSDTEEKENPIFRIMRQNDLNNNNNLNDIIGMQNPINLINNSNNLDNSTMINPYFGNMNQGQNLDDMLNEMSKVLLNLQSDMSKVMTGINQLNLLISNIQKFRANNNMNNNMMGSNNMMNNNINNMMNNFNNMNNLINNNINPMMRNTNIKTDQHSNNPASSTAHLRESGNAIKNKNPIMVNVKENEKISDIIQKYRVKSSNYYYNLKFIFNAKGSHNSLTAAEAGLTNNANIFVVRTPFTLYFRESDGGVVKNTIMVKVKVKEDEKISDIILKYREKSSNHDDNLKFIFNAKNLKNFLTVAEAGLMNNANIFVVKRGI